jgi:transcriptional regulator with AAA-type ATPase domain
MSDFIICWHSTNHPEVLKTFYDLLREGQNITVEKIFLCCQKDGETDRDALALPCEIEIIPLRISSPTDHKEIYEALSDSLKRLYSAKTEDRFHINISPGTPAMHAVWLILYAEGKLKQTEVWQTQWIKSKSVSVLIPVSLEKNTFLQQIPLPIGSGERAVYNPHREYKTEKLKDFLESLRRAAKVKQPILITGERGTGKTRFVEFFYGSLKKKVITFACGSLTDTLAQSQLFGHKKGSFTGAEKEYKGYIKEAENGVLFLDEVQDLSKTVQRQLVRFLEDGSYRPLGGDKDDKSNAELVFASHCTSGELVKIMDSDLFDRINLLHFQIPPLRECIEDLNLFIEEIWRELEKPDYLPEKISLTEKDKELLISTEFPGNFRSLKSFLLYVILESDMAENFNKAIKNGMKKWVASLKSSSITEMNSIEYYLSIPPLEAVKKVQYQIASHHFEKCHSLTQTAEKMGVAVNTVKNWLKNKS